MKIFNGEQFQVITHFDTDGAGCAVLLKYCFGDQITKIYPCGYNKLDAALEKGGGNLILTDLSLTQKQVILVEEKFNKVIWIDHHDSSVGIKYPDDWVVHINIKGSATKLTYLWLKWSKGFDLDPAAKFVEDVNDYDMWIHKSPTSIYLNNIFWKISFWKFCKAFANFKWKVGLWEEAKELQKTKLIEIASYESFEIENLIRVTFATKHISDITLFYPDEKHSLIFRANNNVSVRSEFDLTDFYGTMFFFGAETGGHKNAGGIKWIEDPGELIEIFYKFVKEKEDAENDLI